MKTVFTIFLSLISILTFSGYPFEPKQFLLLELFIIGIASTLLALEPNDKRIEGSFLEAVLIKCFPNAAAMLTPIIAIMMVEKFMPMSLESRNSISMALVILVGFLNLVFLCWPFTKWRAFVVGITAGLIGIVIPVSIFFLGDLLNFAPISHNYNIFFVMLALSVLATVITQVFRAQLEKFFQKRFMKKRQPIKSKIKFFKDDQDEEK